jgi:coatomer subunit delta
MYIKYHLFTKPLDQLYIVLITNKNSNILQDIDTLQLYSRVVSEYCRTTDEREITSNRFELILVFDEVISLGYRENVNLGQIKTISTMESNDERIEAEIQKNKEREAKEESKRRAQMMEVKAKEARKQERASSGFGSSGGFGSGNQSGGFKTSSGANNYGNGYSSGGSPSGEKYGSSSPSYTREEPVVQPTAALSGKGMKLGKKSIQASLFENIKQAEGVREFSQPPPRVEVKQQPESPLEDQLSQEGVHFVVEEKIACTANRDGGLESLVVTGSMTLKVNDPSQTKLQIKVDYEHDNLLQFKTHPYVDRNLWQTQSKVVFAKPLPIGQPIGILKWKYAGKDESQIPLLVTCWPSPTGAGCDVTIEYELQLPISLHNVTIVIPFKFFFLM